MHRIAPSTRWHHLVEQPWHLGVFIVAYAYTHLGKGETWGTVSHITASGCWLKLSRKGELHRYIHHKWSDLQGVLLYMSIQGTFERYTRVGNQ